MSLLTSSLIITSWKPVLTLRAFYNKIKNNIISINVKLIYKIKKLNSNNLCKIKKKININTKKYIDSLLIIDW